MSNHQPTEEIFLSDVANHKMKVLHDDGVYRHLRFSSGSFNMQFDIVTYPWHLVFSGDMGCYVFSRLDDMFEFFRTKPREDKEKIYINTGYWGEKLEAVARHIGYHKYNPEFARENVKRRVDEWIKESEISKEDADALREHLDEEINYDDGMHEAYRTISGFYHKVGEEAYWRQDARSLVKSKIPNFKEFYFQDIYEWTWEDYTYHYVWCCYAVAWSIQQYDKFKEGVKDEANVSSSV